MLTAECRVPLERSDKVREFCAEADLRAEAQTSGAEISEFVVALQRFGGQRHKSKPRARPRGERRGSGAEVLGGRMAL
jgi:hypothetical protein